MTILSFGAVYIGMGVNQIGDLRLSAAFFVLGIFLGSALWWFILSNAAGFFRKRIGPKVFLIINKASGLIILGFGVFLILGSIFL
jgi:arginine exporter protein ArgO